MILGLHRLSEKSRGYARFQVTRKGERISCCLFSGGCRVRGGGILILSYDDEEEEEVGSCALLALALALLRALVITRSTSALPRVVAF